MYSSTGGPLQVHASSAAFQGRLLDFEAYNALVGLPAIRGGFIQATTGARVRSV